MAEMKPIKFAKELQKQLFPDNSFYKKSMVDGGIAPDVESVEIPIAGLIPEAKSGDPATLPIPSTERTDEKKSYPVVQVYVPPVLVRRENEIVTNYGKLQDVVGQFSDRIEERVADISAVNWGSDYTVSGTNYIVRSTGTDTRPATIVGATGTRKRITYADIVAVQGRRNKMNAPAGGSWYALWTPDMIDDLFLIDKLTDADKVQIAKIKNGEIGSIFGFTSMMRWNERKGTNGVSYSVDAQIKRSIDEATAVTDNAAALFWNSKMVRHAEGNAATIINRNVPGYLGGTIIEAVLRFGATQNRNDGKGVISLVETNG